MTNDDDVYKLIKYSNYCMDNYIFGPLKQIFGYFNELNNDKYKNDIFILKCRKKELIDYFSLDDSKKLELIKTIDKCKKLIEIESYEESLEILYSFSNKVKHDILLFYKGTCLYNLKKYNKAEKILRNYSYKGYSKQIDSIITLIKIYVYQGQIGKAKNYLLKYINISKILNQYNEKVYMELSELINGNLKNNKLKNNNELSDMDNIVNSTIELLNQNKIRDAFNIIESLKLDALQIAKIKLKIVEFLYKSNLGIFAQKYYKDIIKTPNKDNEIKKAIKKLEITRKLYK